MCRQLEESEDRYNLRVTVLHFSMVSCFSLMLPTLKSFMKQMTNILQDAVPDAGRRTVRTKHFLTKRYIFHIHLSAHN
jgi:hypothetical protein